MRTTENGNAYEITSKRYTSEKSPYLKNIFLIITVLFTFAGTSIMSVSMLSDFWEHTIWNKMKIYEIAEQIKLTNLRNHNVQIDPSLDDSIISLLVYKDEDVYTKSKPITIVHLVAMHDGIWTLCVSLTKEQQFLLLRRDDFPTKICFNHLLAKLFEAEPEYPIDWNYRLQNVSISCALVCLIILGSAALVGIFGVLKHQLSAILVTGVMYLLAGTFALFTVLIIHFKRVDCKPHNYDFYNTIKMT